MMLYWISEFQTTYVKLIWRQVQHGWKKKKFVFLKRWKVLLKRERDQTAEKLHSS